MKIVIVIILIITALLNETLRPNAILLITLGWLIYTIIYSIGLYKTKDKKIVTDKFSIEPPNNNYSSHIRYLFKGKADNKVFIVTIMELLLKKSISLVRYNKNEYYLIDNKVKDEVLTKNEENVKKILFKDIGDDAKISLNKFKKSCSKNSGYINAVYKEWQSVFECECAYDKYFKSIKNKVDSSMFYFCIAFIVALYNVVFIKKIGIALIIFTINSILIKYVNDYKHKEEEAKEEYKEWLKFRNYIMKKDNTFDELDILTLENYATYAYVLDCYKEFKNILYRKYCKNKTCFDDSVLLSIMNLSIFDDLEKIINKGINITNIKTRFLFTKNRGRRE